MKKIILIIHLICLFPAIVSSRCQQDGEPFYAGQDGWIITYSLTECLQMGLENNYDIRIVRNNQRITDNNVTLGNAGFLPSVDFSGAYSGTLNNTDQFPREGSSIKNRGVNNNTLSGGLNLNWTAFDGFTVRTSYERLRQVQQRGELATRFAVENLISDITTAYFTYIRQFRRLSNLRYAVQLSQERVRIVEARYNIGAVSRLDLQQANVDLNTDRSNLLRQYEVMHIMLTGLNELMAVNNIGQEFLPADTLIVFDPGIEHDMIYRNMLEDNVILRIARKEGDISKIDLRQVRNQAYPYVRVNGGYGYTGNWYDNGSYSRQQNLGLNYGVTLGVNVFDGLNRRRRERNAAIELENTLLQYQQAELSLRADLANAWMAYRNNMKLTDLETSNLETAKDNYEIAMERYKLGQLSGIELREAQNSLLEAEERLVQSQYDTKLCEISLLQLGGFITAYLAD